MTQTVTPPSSAGLAGGAAPGLKVVVEHQPLLDAVSAAAQIVPAKSTLPIGLCLLLEADASSSTISVVATNLISTEVIRRVPAQVRRPGRVAVPARFFADWLKAVDGESGRLMLATAPVRARLHAIHGRFRARFAALPGDEYPRLSFVDASSATAGVQVEGKHFHQALGALSAATLQVSVIGQDLRISDPTETQVMLLRRFYGRPPG